ncbi:uncharacterized protein LOC142221453 isoform X2 [Haematobia irritans]|uniref:uncharacterized protein LOC142221453 isoform X2 n=1 Tax=Haematobia irritans TaxID=7368 RepID=UPI003F5044DC
MLPRISLVVFVLFGFLLITDCQDKIRAKRAKRPRAQDPVNFEPEPHQDLENEDSTNSEKDIPEIPSNFLSPSVREYLELGKSIPGWHYCDIDGRQASFLCPNGTQFSQAVFVCDWWFNVRCDLSPRLYAINARLYQRPKVNPTRPHRIITKELVDDIFN